MYIFAGRRAHVLDEKGFALTEYISKNYGVAFMILLDFCVIDCLELVCL